jgi:hypothetical protein
MALVQRCGANDWRAKRCGPNDWRLKKCPPCLNCSGADTPSQITLIISGVPSGACLETCVPYYNCRTITLLSSPNGAFVLAHVPGIPCKWCGGWYTYHIKEDYTYCDCQHVSYEGDCPRGIAVVRYPGKWTVYAAGLSPPCNTGNVLAQINSADCSVGGSGNFPTSGAPPVDCCGHAVYGGTVTLVPE